MAWAQSPQNPSPMVEHTRRHPRLTKQQPEGRRIPLQIGHLFVPAKIRNRHLLIHFHGADWIAEMAVAKKRCAAVCVNAGAGSSRYARLFEDASRFPEWISECEAKAGRSFDAVYLSGWSAGYGAIREILKQHPDRIAGVLLIDGLHTNYRNSKPGPLESELETGPLEGFEQFARLAIAGRKRMVIVHSEIFPGTFASTTETSDYLLRRLGLSRTPVVRWGPMGTQQLSEVRRNGFVVAGYAGNSAPDHVDLLHALPHFLDWLF